MIIKNSNIRRGIFDNRYVIFAIIFAIILVLYLIQVLNENAKNKSQKQKNTLQNIVVESEDKSNQTVIYGEDVSNVEQQNNIKIIDEFINYCNNKEIEKAYNLLTNECKEAVFSNNIQYFKKNYVDKIFTKNKMYSVQSWVNKSTKTYKVKILDDMLSTGIVSSEKDTLEDYYTIVEQENKYLLNINNYIGKQNCNKQVNVNGIKIHVLYKNIYKDYETYNIKVENNTLKTILLDSQEKVDSTYLLGSNEKNYSAFMYEIDKHNIIIEPKKEKDITIKFNKIYSNQTEMKKIVFSDIITDYEEYEKTNNKKEYLNRAKIEIEI